MINKEILIEYIEMLKDSCKGEEGDDQDPFLFGRRMGSISALVKLKIALEVNDYDVSIVGLDFDIEKNIYNKIFLVNYLALQPGCFFMEKIMGEVVKRSNIDNDKEIQFSNLSETLKHVVNGKTILEHLNKYFNDIFHWKN